MSRVVDQVECPQCGYCEADHEFNCDTNCDVTLCRHCGYRETWEPNYGDDGKCWGWKHDISEGAGALCYKAVGEVSFVAHYLHSVEEVTDAETWLREALDKRQVDRGISYLTRWNQETKQLELVIGKPWEGLKDAAVGPPRMSLPTRDEDIPQEWPGGPSN